MSVETIVPVRERILVSVIDLLRGGGLPSVSTRGVASAAGVHAPIIYRLFGDKQGLLDAAAEFGLARHLDQKRQRAWPADPVDALRSGWDEQIEFALSNGALYLLMIDPWRATATSPASDASRDDLRRRVDAIARAGRLRVDEARATDLIAAIAQGVALALLHSPADQRDETVSALARDAVIAAVTTDAADAPDGPASAAIALRAALPLPTVLSPSESALLGDWLDRVARADPDR